MALLLEHFAGHPEIGRAVRMISDDEAGHLARTHEGLLRLAAVGHGPFVRRSLRTRAFAEIRVHRDVGLAVMDRRSRISGRPRARYPAGPAPAARCSRPASTPCTPTNAWPAGAAWSPSACPDASTPSAAPPPPRTSTPDPHNHSRRLNSRYSSTSSSAIARITAG